MIDNTAIRDEELDPPFIHTALMIKLTFKLPFEDDVVLPVAGGNDVFFNLRVKVNPKHESEYLLRLAY